MTNIIKELKALEKRTEMLEDILYNHPDDIKSLEQNVQGVFEGTANFMQEVAIKQSDLDILRDKLIKLELEIQKIKTYINRYLR